MKASGYIFPLVKVVEFICGILFVTGFFVPLAAIVIFPISLNILLFHMFVNPDALPVALFVIGANLFLAFAYRTYYDRLFTAK